MSKKPKKIFFITNGYDENDELIYQNKIIIAALKSLKKDQIYYKGSFTYINKIENIPIAEVEFGKEIEQLYYSDILIVNKSIETFLIGYICGIFARMKKFEPEKKLIIVDMGNPDTFCRVMGDYFVYVPMDVYLDDVTENEAYPNILKAISKAKNSDPFKRPMEIVK